MKDRGDSIWTVMDHYWSGGEEPIVGLDIVTTLRVCDERIMSATLTEEECGMEEDSNPKVKEDGLIPRLNEHENNIEDRGPIDIEA